MLAGRSRPATLTSVLLLELLVARSLTEVGQDLRQLGDHDVVGCQSRLSLKEKESVRVTDPGTVVQRRLRGVGWGGGNGTSMLGQSALLRISVVGMSVSVNSSSRSTT